MSQYSCLSLPKWLGLKVCTITPQWCLLYPTTEILVSHREPQSWTGKMPHACLSTVKEMKTVAGVLPWPFNSQRGRNNSKSLGNLRPGLKKKFKFKWVGEGVAWNKTPEFSPYTIKNIKHTWKIFSVHEKTLQFYFNDDAHPIFKPTRPVC